MEYYSVNKYLLTFYLTGFNIIYKNNANACITKEGIMSKFSQLVVLSLLITTLLFSCASTPKVVKTTIIGDSAVDLSAAEIYSVSPTVVLPGTLMSITGAGFGEDAGIINIGGVDVTTFLGWEDDVIWFRVPEGIADDAEIQVGYEYAEPYITTAPEGSITVKWIIDAAATQEMVNVKYTQYKLDKAPKWVAPLHIKGQWSKSEGTYGLKDDGWDGGSRQLMYNIPGTDTWITEAVFTPEAMNSFAKTSMKFAVEDGDDEFRNLSSFESDFAYIIKSRWAGELGLSGDPAFKIDEENKNFDPETRTITVKYPIQ